MELGDLHSDNFPVDHAFAERAVTLADFNCRRPALERRWCVWCRLTRRICLLTISRAELY